MSESICVVFAADEGYAVPLSVAIRSLVDNTRSRDLEIYVLDGGLKPESKVLVEQSAGAPIKFLHPNKPTFSFAGSEAPHVSAATYFRFEIPQLLPTHSKVIYLDCDLVVLADIAELWNIELPPDCPLAAALEIGCPRGLLDPFTQEIILACHGFGERGAYFNAGVLVLNLDVLRREEKLFDNARAFIEEFKPPLADQDYLNLLYEKSWLQLPAKWNVTQHARYQVSKFLSFDEYEDAMNNPAIVHFASPNKPWLLDGQLVRYANKWEEYANKTAWPKSAHYDEAGTRQNYARMLANVFGLIRAKHPDFDLHAFVNRLSEDVRRAVGS